MLTTQGATDLLFQAEVSIVRAALEWTVCDIGISCLGKTVINATLTTAVSAIPVALSLIILVIAGAISYPHINAWRYHYFNALGQDHLLDNLATIVSVINLTW